MSDSTNSTGRGFRLTYKQVRIGMCINYDLFLIDYVQEMKYLDSDPSFISREIKTDHSGPFIYIGIVQCSTWLEWFFFFINLLPPVVYYKTPKLVN